MQATMVELGRGTITWDPHSLNADKVPKKKQQKKRG